SNNPGCRQSVTLNIIAKPAVQAFIDDPFPTTTCQGNQDIYPLVAQISGQDVVSVDWTTNGAGQLTTTGPLTAEYLPSLTEFGVVTFTATTNDPDLPNPCGSGIGQVTLTINKAASATITAPVAVCTNTLPINLSVALDGTGVTGGTWSSQSGS